MLTLRGKPSHKRGRLVRREGATAQRSGNLLDLLAIAADSAARTVMRYYLRNPVGERSEKREDKLHPLEKDTSDPRTVVSKADLASEKVIFSILRRKLNCTFLSEEAGGLPGDPEAEFRAVIDSLDGSRNFLQGSNGLFGIAIGIERLGSLIGGAIALPYFDELLIAERGRGVYLKSSKETEERGHQKKVSKPAKMPATLAMARINIARGAAESKVLAEPPLSRILQTANESVNYASSAVAFASVALGRIDGLILPHQRYWDFAAGAVIIKELGGQFEVWRDNWRNQVEESELASATQESYFDIAAALHPVLFQEIKQYLQQPHKGWVSP